MSYILDALKKAERERGIKQIPTLMTDHTPHVADRKILWISVSLLAVCLLAAAWLFIPSRPSTTYPSAQIDDPTPTSAAGQDGRTHVEASLPQSVTERGRSGADEMSYEATAPAADVSENSARRQSLPDVLRASVPYDVMAPDGEDYENLPPHEIIRSVTRTNRESAPQAPQKSQPVFLKEAVSRMTLSLLVYSDVKEERMVYINGSRYKEGDYVDGVYLLESITEEGAILTHELARALLKPRAK